MSKNMKTVAADADDALTFLQFTFHPKIKMVQRFKKFLAMSSSAITFATSSSCLRQLFYVSTKGNEKEKKVLVMIMRISCLRENTRIRF